MPAGGAVVGGIAASQVLTGLIGQQQSAANRAAAAAAAQAALNDINAVGAPPDQQAAIILQKFQQAGLYQPGMEQQISAGISQASLTPTDTAGHQAQISALGQLQARAGTGYSAQDRAALNQILQQTGTAEQGQLGSINQAMQARGMGGSGANLAQQLQAASSAGANASNQGIQAAAQGQQAALSAAVNSGQLGGQLSASDFAQAQAKAQAADRFKLFDTQNAIAQQQRNVGAANQGQLFNLSNAQQIQNANTQQANAEQARELAAQQQNWQEQMQQAQAKANANLGYGTNQMQQANATSQQWAGMGAGVGAAGGAGLNYWAKQPGNTNSDGSLSLDDSGTENASATNYGSGSTNTQPFGGGSAQAMQPGYAEGGEVHNPLAYCMGGSTYAAGGMINPPTAHLPMPSPQIHFNPNPVPINIGGMTIGNNGGVSQNADQMMGANLAHGGPAQSPIQALLMNHAGKVPGKAKVSGDSLQNDKVHALLSPGEIVVPRSVVDMGPAAAYGFVHATMKHKDNK